MARVLVRSHHGLSEQLQAVALERFQVDCADLDRPPTAAVAGIEVLDKLARVRIRVERSNEARHARLFGEQVRIRGAGALGFRRYEVLD